MFRAMDLSRLPSAAILLALVCLPQTTCAQDRNSQQALLALESFPLGSTLTPKVLEGLNNLPGGQPIKPAAGAMSADARELIASEKARLEALEFDMVAAADLLFRAATMPPQQRRALGYDLTWLFGPVTAPNRRAGSKDGLAGLRIIGQLRLPAGQQINSIFALKFYPGQEGVQQDQGQIGLLSDVDNFRLEVRLFNEGRTTAAYAFQSFSVAGQGGKMTLRPGLYVDERTGAFTKPELVFQGLGTSCITCHLSGPKFTPGQLTMMQDKNYPAMEGFQDFLDQMKHWGAKKTLRQETEAIMRTTGPAGLLPLTDMLRANREHWLANYPRYLARKNLEANEDGSRMKVVQDKCDDLVKQVRNELDELQRSVTELSKKLGASRVGRIELVNSYPKEMLFRINGNDYRLPRSTTRTLDKQLAGLFTYEVYELTWGGVRLLKRQTPTLLPGDTYTITVR